MAPAIMRTIDEHDPQFQADLALLGRSLKACHADQEYLRDNYDRLKDEYPDQFVAIYEGAVVIHTRDVEEYKQQIRRYRTAAVDFLTTSTAPLIL